MLILNILLSLFYESVPYCNNWSIFNFGIYATVIRLAILTEYCVFKNAYTSKYYQYAIIS